MATPFSFQSLNFNNIPGREIEANRRYTAGLEGMFKSIGDGAKDIAESYMSEEERKKREAEDKKKWDNMIAQQEYQKEQDRLNKEYQASRDAIADARYNNEWNEKQKKLQLEENKYYRDRNALENLKAGIRQAYTPEALQKYGPSAQARLAAIMNSNDLATAQQQVGELNRDMYLMDTMDFQREQNERAARQEEQAKIAENMLNEVAERENASTFSFNVNAKLPPKELLPAYRDEIQENLDYLRSNPTPSLNKNAKIRDYKTLLDAINKDLSNKSNDSPWNKPKNTK